MAEKPIFSLINQGIGFRIKNNITRPPAEIIQAFKAFETPEVSDILNRLYTMNSEIKNIVNDDVIVGPACTVKVFPGDNLMVHKALDIAKPGDILVVDAGGHKTNAVLGDMIATKAKFRGIAGIVVDGLVRDYKGIIKVGLPVFASGVSPIGPLQRGPGELNYPVSCGGIVVNSGDVIFGDSSGVVVIRKEFAEEILERVTKQNLATKDYAEALRRGDFSNKWIDEILEREKCPYEE